MRTKEYFNCAALPLGVFFVHVLHGVRAQCNRGGVHHVVLAAGMGGYTMGRCMFQLKTRKRGRWATTSHTEKIVVFLVFCKCVLLWVVAF